MNPPEQVIDEQAIHCKKPRKLDNVLTQQRGRMNTAGEPSEQVIDEPSTHCKKPRKLKKIKNKNKKKDQPR